VNAHRVPAALQEPLSSGVAALEEQTPLCVRPVPVSPPTPATVPVTPPAHTSVSRPEPHHGKHGKQGKHGHEK
jgi:hypothetical protein